MKQILHVGLFLFFINESSYAQSAQWHHFKHKYGFSIDLPDCFTIGSLTSSAIQYYNCDEYDDVMVTVETNGIGSRDLMKKDYDWALKNNGDVAYKVLKADWYVVSGEYDDGISYEKEFIKGDATYTLKISYPKKYKGLIESIIARISKSFN